MEKLCRLHDQEAVDSSSTSLGLLGFDFVVKFIAQYKPAAILNAEPLDKARLTWLLYPSACYVATGIRSF